VYSLRHQKEKRSMDYFAGGSLATFTSRTILPVSSTMQTLVVLTETSSPAKWSMLRFSDQSEHRTTSGNAPARAQSLRVSRAVSDPGRQGAPRAIDPRPHGAARPRSSLRRTCVDGWKICPPSNRSDEAKEICRGRPSILTSVRVAGSTANKFEN
jgi:hypothetical protein